MENGLALNSSAPFLTLHLWTTVQTVRLKFSPRLPFNVRIGFAGSFIYEQSKKNLFQRSGLTPILALRLERFSVAIPASGGSAEHSFVKQVDT